MFKLINLFSRRRHKKPKYIDQQTLQSLQELKIEMNQLLELIEQAINKTSNGNQEDQ